MAEAIIDTKWDLPTIVIAAGGNGDRGGFIVDRGNVLVVNDVTQDALDAAIADFDVAANDARLAVFEVQNTRAAAYPSIGDQLDMLWHAIDTGDWTAAKVKTTEFYTALKAVKTSHPKPAGD